MSHATSDVELGLNGKHSSSTGNLTSMSFGDRKPTVTLSKAFLTTGLPVVFKNITYTVINSQNKKEKIDLLKNVSGSLRPGELTALMGPSGSGKSTLLDILAGRKTVGTVRGDIRFGGEPPNKVMLRRFTGYVEQFDTLLDMLTVEEMLMYTAEMKRPIEQSKAEKKSAVEELLTVLALESCRNVRIGSSMARGISGGQSKRVNIGIALITNPKILFLDEPTSGLDSYTSNEVMTVVKSLAHMGITVCATIHSPTPYTFKLFDRLLLLLRGQMAYLGPNGPTAVEYFQTSCPNIAAMQEGENSAEWIVDLTTSADRQGMAGDFADNFKNHALHAQAMADIDDDLKKASQGKVSRNELGTDHKRANKVTVIPTWWALRTLFKYRTLRLYTMPEFLGPRIADKFLNSFIIFSLFWGLGDNFQQNNLINVSAVLFMWVANPAFAAVAYTPAIVLERPVFVREQNDGLYRVITYLISKMIEELIIALLSSLVFSNVVFWALQLQGSWALFWLVLWCTLSIGIVLGYFIAAISPNMDVANAALPAYVVTLLFFAGFLIRWDDIPNYWIWYSYIDFIRYAWGSLMKNQFNGDRDAVFITTPSNQTILQYYSLDGIDMWGWLGIEFCFFVFFFFSAYLALRYIRHDKR